MRTWSTRSKSVYDELDIKLQKVLTHVRDEVADISLICGHRNQKDQDEKFDSGHSKIRWPDGKHNKLPSLAVDFQPYPLPADKAKLWASLAYVAGHAIRIGESYGYKIRWGGDWDRDGDLTDQNFDDLYHLETD